MLTKFKLLDKIIDFLPFYEIPNIVILNKKNTQICYDPNILFSLKKSFYTYLDHLIFNLSIIDIQDDTRDDCGTTGYIYYLQNGDIIDSEEYDYYKTDNIQDIILGFRYFMDNENLDLYDYFRQKLPVKYNEFKLNL